MSRGPSGTARYNISFERIADAFSRRSISSPLTVSRVIRITTSFHGGPPFLVVLQRLAWTETADQTWMTVSSVPAGSILGGLSGKDASGATLPPRENPSVSLMVMTSPVAKITFGTPSTASLGLLGLSSFTGLNGSLPVSYTHLRAHETRHDLVCRLLLEK